MIFIEEYEEMLQRLGREYFVFKTMRVNDLSAWAKENKADLSEPHQPMKLVAEADNNLAMVIQSEIPERMLNDVINNLSIRWSLRDNITDPSAKLDSVKKRLAFCFLKECSMTVKGIGGDELLEDEWAISSMEKLGFFEE